MKTPKLSAVGTVFWLLRGGEYWPKHWRCEVRAAFDGQIVYRFWVPRRGWHYEMQSSIWWSVVTTKLRGAVFGTRAEAWANQRKLRAEAAERKST